MKYRLLLFLLVGISFSGICQDNPNDYYDKNFKRSRARIVNLPNTQVFTQRVYVGLEANYRIASSTLTNYMSGLLSIAGNNDVGWSGYVGFNSNQKWAVELAYTPIPVFTTLWIAAGRGGASFVAGTTLRSFPVRFKKNIFTLDKDTKTVSIWLGGGVVISPHATNAKLATFNLTGKSNITYGSDGLIASYDTLALGGQTAISNRNLFQLEGSVELIGKITDGFYIDVFSRAVVGQNKLVNTDIQFVVNSQVSQTAQYYSNGFYYTFGLGFRYDFDKGIKYRTKGKNE